MAWAAVANSTVWQYENTATASNTYSDTVGSANVYNAGVRTFTYAGGNTRKTYARCRKVGETIERGELSWDYFDAQG
jgi:hypothetical protein